MSGMKVSQAVKAARGHWAQILPALGVNILKNRHQPCPVDWPLYFHTLFIT